jgi:hypothetical protein
MKKLIIIALIAMIPAIGMSQTGVVWSKFMVADTLTADTNVTISTSGIYSSWNVFFAIGTTTSTASTVKVQVSPDNSNWIDYANMITQTLVTNTNFSFEDDYVSFRYMRFVFDIEAGESVPINGWYTFKK